MATQELVLEQTPETSDINDRFGTFDEMNLSENILRGIYSYGFERPSAIQQLAIVPIIKGNDIIAQAQSGTGKTGTFTISVLQKINFELLEPQGLIIVPTRELALQINTVISEIGSFCGVKVYCCIGGQDVRGDEHAIRRSDFERKLPHRLEKRQPFNIARCATDLGDEDIHVFATRINAFLNLVRHVRDHLHGFP
jgi:superfamily II DNA/RNA helicase